MWAINQQFFYWLALNKYLAFSNLSNFHVAIPHKKLLSYLLSCQFLWTHPHHAFSLVSKTLRICCPTRWCKYHDLLFHPCTSCLHIDPPSSWISVLNHDVFHKATTQNRTHHYNKNKHPLHVSNHFPTNLCIQILLYSVYQDIYKFRTHYVFH